MAGETEILADYVARASYENLPMNVVDRAKVSLADTIACGLGGRKTPEGDILIDMMKDIGGKPEATVIGDKKRLSFIQAAQVNRVLTNILDYDDTLLKAGHMSTIAVPVALALGERIGASGKDIINAIVLAYEVLKRIRDAVDPTEEAFWSTFEKPNSGMHFGATIVAVKLLGLSAQQVACALGLTGFVRPTRVAVPDRAKRGMPRWRKVTGGEIIIPSIHATFLAQRGFPGDRQIFDQDRGYEVSVGSDRFDASKLIANLGTEYPGTLGNGFKFYASCRYLSPTLDAVAEIMTENEIKVEEVEQILVKVGRWVAENFLIYEPNHMIQAQFSLPYAVTMVLLGEPTGPNWYTKEMLKDQKARELQRKVIVEEDPVATSKFYTESTSPSTVEIQLKDGRHFKKHVEHPRGEPENPFTERDHINKLTSMALWLGMKQSQIDELRWTLDRLEEVENISELTRLLVP